MVRSRSHAEEKPLRRGVEPWESLAAAGGGDSVKTISGSVCVPASPLRRRPSAWLPCGHLPRPSLPPTGHFPFRPRTFQVQGGGDPETSRLHVHVQVPALLHPHRPRRPVSPRGGRAVPASRTAGSPCLLPTGRLPSGVPPPPSPSALRPTRPPQPRDDLRDSGQCPRGQALCPHPGRQMRS